LLAAYRSGLFPMGESGGELTWWSPDPRGILPVAGLYVSRSLRRSCRKFELTVDVAFEDVIDGCAERPEDERWITPEIQAAYVRLHELGWAHSIEAWDPATTELAGGLYGVAIGGLFAAESMFHRRRDASKVALVALVESLAEPGVERLLDIQWLTPHLASLGAVEVSRQEYLARLERALRLPLPATFADPS
jgi:leucyl/phenylalanyl-tRNA--protein transferase